jgi:hypothetical protein
LTKLRYRGEDTTKVALPTSALQEIRRLVMKKKFLRLGIGAILCLFLAAPSLWAQAIEMDLEVGDLPIAPASPTGVITRDIFGTDVNDYLDPVNWSQVEYQKFFSFVGYSNIPALGFVTRIGGGGGGGGINLGAD